jgi:hypothetical protein
MTWKTYTAVSGATVLAGWLASSPPSNAPAPAAASRRTPASAASATAGSDIEEQAARLQARLRQEPAYRDPARNPFRFGEREVPRPAPSASPAPKTLEPTAIEPVTAALPPPPPVTLSGIAEDRSGDGVERTAVLSSQAGVLLVREGETVLGRYRVTRIEANAVELTDTLGGPAVRLTIRP